MSGTTSRRLAGLATMSIDGEAWDVVSDLAYQCSRIKRETLAGQTAVEGFSEMPVAGSITATLRDRGDASVAAFNGLTNSTIVVQMANGKVVFGSGMWCTELGDVKTQEGTFEVKFEGPDVTEGLA